MVRSMLSNMGDSVDFVPPIATAALLQVLPPGMMDNLPGEIVLILLGGWLVLSGIEKINRMFLARSGGSKMLPSADNGRTMENNVEHIRRLTKEMEHEVCDENGALQTLRRDHDHYLRADLSEWEKTTGQKELSWHNHTTVVTLQRVLESMGVLTDKITDGITVHNLHTETVLGFVESVDGRLARLEQEREDGDGG